MRIDSPNTIATFSFDAAKRNELSNTTTSGQFLVQIVDASNNAVIFARQVTHAQKSWNEYSYQMNFPKAGNYIVRFTEQGADDSLDSVVDNISIFVCFTAGMLIRTATGPRPIDDLEIGDRVWTAGAGLQPLR